MIVEDTELTHIRIISDIRSLSGEIERLRRNGYAVDIAKHWFIPVESRRS